MRKVTPGGISGLNNIYRGRDNAISPALFLATTCSQRTKSPRRLKVSNYMWIDHDLRLSLSLTLRCYYGVSTGCKKSLRGRDAANIQGSFLIPEENIFPERFVMNIYSLATIVGKLHH